jgi:hypothetical protein
MSFFINKCLLHNDRIISHKSTGNKPRYIICDCFNAARTFKEIKYYLDLGYNPSDIFILGPSIKSNGGRLSPIRVLENTIKKKLPDVMVYVPMSDDAKFVSFSKGRNMFDYPILFHGIPIRYDFDTWYSPLIFYAFNNGLLKK